MKIHTDLVENKEYCCPIQDNLLKHSQEYRVLATLRYLSPGKYETMTTGESPDLQDCINGIGIEVTAAVREIDMKASKAFTKLCQKRNNQEAKKYKEIIESSSYSLESLPWGQPSISTVGTSNGEKKCFQNSISNKKAKLQKYRDKLDLLGLSVLLLENPTSEAENHFVDWIREVFQEDNKRFCLCNLPPVLYLL